MKLIYRYIKDISNLMKGQIRNILPSITSINIRVMVPNLNGERTLVLLLLYTLITKGNTNSRH